MSRKLLGLHINAVTQNNEMLAFIAAAKPPVVKIIQDNPEFSARVHQVNPETLLVGREYWEPGDVIERPVEAAKAKFDAIKRRGDYPFVDAWEGLNERNSYHWESFVAQAAFDYHLARYLHEDGRKYVALSWGEGHPPPYWENREFPWRNFTQHYKKVFEIADFFGVHEYGYPRMFSEGMEGFHILRFPWWYYKLPEELRKPIIISECGIDSGVAEIRPGYGWQRICSPWQFLVDLQAYNSELQPYPVKGFLPFCWGTHDTQWDTFDWTPELVGLIKEWMVSEQEGGEMLPEWIVDIRDEVAFDTGRTRDRLRGITVHHEGTRADLEDVLAFYKRFLGVSYHFLIDEKIYYLNGLNERVWHCGDGASGPWNTEGVACCFTGDLRGQGHPSRKQLENFRKLRTWLLTQGVGEEIVSHKAVRRPPYSTECPGDWWPNEAPPPRELLEDTGEGIVERLRQENAALRSRVEYARNQAVKIVEYLEGE